MPKLISDAYQKLNFDLHKSIPEYGARAAKHVATISACVQSYKAKTLLDYGCGKGTLKPAIRKVCPNLVVREYDPAIPGKRERPDPCDIVAALDVMEHIEPEYLDNVLADMASLTLMRAVLQVSTVPALKLLSDGRNAHLIVQPLAWWTDQFSRHFDVVEVNGYKADKFFALLAPRTPVSASR